MPKRKQHGPEFKARVALEALKGEQTVAELARDEGRTGACAAPNAIALYPAPALLPVAARL